MALFSDADAYEQAMGKWSRIAGLEFLDWLGPPAGLRWLDVGCGGGAFTDLILGRASPKSVAGVDPVEDQIAFAKSRDGHGQVDYQVGDALDLPYQGDGFDTAIMALVIAFLPDRAKAIAEMRRVVRPGGTIATYMWDLPRGGFTQQPLLDALGLNQEKMPGYADSAAGPLRQLFEAADLEEVESRTIHVEMKFRDFDEFWSTQTSFPSTPVRALREMSESEVERVKASLRETLPTNPQGQVAYFARANAVKGRKPA
jgi:ubiquinone/menaquinone biosynthesis C-methylase UbiE